MTTTTITPDADGWETETEVEEKRARGKYTPLAAGTPVDELPPASSGAVSVEVLDAINAATGRWVPISRGGRTASSAANLLSGAAKRRGLTIEVVTRDGEVYARAVKKVVAKATAPKATPKATKAPKPAPATVSVRRRKVTPT